MKRVVVTGASGLIGRHAMIRLHAKNCAAQFKGEPRPYEVLGLDRSGFGSDETLQRALATADVVLHFAGTNRGDPLTVERDNPFIAERLVQTCRAIEARPHIVYSNSTHSSGNTPYGRGKARAAEILGGLGSGFTDLVLPHIFGEGARPYYNNVTATLIDQIISGDAVTVNSGGTVSLLHAGKAAEIAIESGISRMSHRINPAGRAVLVSDLCELLTQFHRLYSANVYPSLQDDFTVALFNSYRSAIYPSKWPRALKLNSDARGHLFEAVKGGGGGQTFLSSTAVGERRGDHFHLNKVERFLVLQGDAVIRIRPVLGEKIYEYRVSGDTPAVVDIPTLHTHSIENVGDDALMTLFWAHEHFDPDNPDTFADRVLL